jgi:hypothetical protein
VSLDGVEPPSCCQDLIAGERSSEASRTRRGESAIPRCVRSLVYGLTTQRGRD